VGDIGGLESPAGFFEVTKIIDDTNMIVQSEQRAAWIANISTGKIVEGQDVKLLNVLKVTGTKKFRSATGEERTLTVLQPVDTKEIAQKIASPATPNVAKGPTTTPPAVASKSPTVTKSPALAKSPVPSATPATRGDRAKWLNTSYDTTIYHIKDKQWGETDNKTGKLKWHLEEKEVTKDYIELYLGERKQTIRLRPTRMDLKDGNNWKWLSNGKWEP